MGLFEGEAPRALDLFCGAGGVSFGLQRAGFDVTGVDINPQPHYRGGTFVQADAMTFPLEGFDFIWASTAGQAHTTLRRLHSGRDYPDLIPATRERLLTAGIPWCIENVPGAPLAGQLLMLCGTMFGLCTPDGRAELRRHRWFETSFSIPLRPACQHGHAGPESLSVCGTGMGPGNRGKEAAQRAKVLTVTGHTPVDNTRRRLVLTIAGDHPDAKTGGLTASGRSSARERFTVEDARAAMGISWMPMKSLSQAIPPAYSEWIGREALREFAARKPAVSEERRIA